MTRVEDVQAIRALSLPLSVAIDEWSKTKLGHHAPALADAAVAALPKLGWQAPYWFVALTKRYAEARDEHVDVTVTFDQDGNGPWCQHGGIDILCGKCGAKDRAASDLAMALTRPELYR